MFMFYNFSGENHLVSTCKQLVSTKPKLECLLINVIFIWYQKTWGELQSMNSSDLLLTLRCCLGVAVMVTDVFKKHVLICISFQWFWCMLSVLFTACLFISITILPRDPKENINKMLIVTFLKLLPEGKRGLSIKCYKLTKGQNNYGMEIQLNIYMTSF